MPRITILDPTATPPSVDTDPGPALGQTAGAAIGIRYDLTWRSFDWVREEWESLLRDDGARVEHHCAGDRTGEAAEETRAALQRFVQDREVLVSGLGN